MGGVWGCGGMGVGVGGDSMCSCVVKVCMSLLFHLLPQLSSTRPVIIPLQQAPLNTTPTLNTAPTVSTTSNTIPSLNTAPSTSLSSTPSRLTTAPNVSTCTLMLKLLGGKKCYEDFLQDMFMTPPSSCTATFSTMRLYCT